MKLTLSSHSHSNNKQQSPSRLKRTTQQSSNIDREERDRPVFINCPDFVFGNCIDLGGRRNTQQNQVIEGGEEQTNALKRRANLAINQNQVPSQNSRKHKICLSLKSTPTKNYTPQKKSNLFGQNKCYSQNKKDNRQDESYCNNANLLTPKNKLELDKQSKSKTEPIQLQTSVQKNPLKLKESLKPSTNLMTANSSRKQSVNSNKIKLTLSNNFKSSISQQNMNIQASLDESYLVMKKVETGLASHQVFIEESLMTQKMMNIYGERSGSFLKQPSSNIVYYNQVMNNEAIWKHPPPTRVDSNEAKYQQKNTSILRGLDEHEDSYNLPETQSANKVEIREKFKERKYIGQYAKTIKTFNESEQKDESQSVVLQHGFPLLGQFPTFAINRGSIKECPSESAVIPRQYSSFGQQQSFNLAKNRQHVSDPIQQNSYDSQKQN